MTRRLQPAELERLNTWLFDIVANLRPDAPSRTQGDGSSRFGQRGSLVIGPTAGLWYDHEAGSGGRNALSLIRHHGIANPDDWANAFLERHQGMGPIAQPGKDHSDACETSIAAANYCITHATGIAGTPAERYLIGRSLHPPYPDNLQYLPQARQGEGALLLRVMSGDDVAAVQVTYLDEEGNKSQTAPQRRTYRRLPELPLVAEIPSLREAVPQRTLVTEGLEDALSLRAAAAGSRIIAGLGVAGIARVHVTTDEEVIIFRDGDAPDSAASQQLQKAIDRLTLKGACVRVTDTPEGMDANDILLRCGAEELLRLVDDAPDAVLSADGWIERCAGMPLLEYERIRGSVARELGVRKSALDLAVRNRAGIQQGAADEGAESALPELSAWETPVDVADVLGDISRLISEYVHLPVHGIDTMALWAAHTFIMDHIAVSPRLAVQSPGPGCGKTVALEVVSNLVPRALATASITPAAVFRVIENRRPTLLIDEADQLFANHNNDLLAVLNSSHRKSTAFVMRAVEVQPGVYEAMQFATWAPVMFAGIRELPPTLQDRSIVLWLERALPGEVHKHLRDGQCPELSVCARKLMRWSEDLVELPDVRMPAIFSNRVGDNWRPLFAIAQMAGGEWPQRCLNAATKFLAMSSTNRIADLLSDIRETFGQRDRMLTREIVDGLLLREEGPYGEANRGRAITDHWLARQLRGVIDGSSGTMRHSSGGTARGYFRSQFDNAFARYGITDNATSASVTNETRNAAGDMTCDVVTDVTEQLGPSETKESETW